MTGKLPVGVSGLTKALDAHGWTHTITHGTGTVVATTKGEVRGNGTRPNVKIDAPCESIAVRAAHQSGRQIRAVFVCRTDKAKRSWSMATAWRTPHPEQPCTSCASGGCGNQPHPDRPACDTCLGDGCGRGEHGPRELAAKALRAYIEEAAP